MPDLDVAFVLDDPMFNDSSIVIERVTRVAGSKGRAITSSVQIPIEGVAIAGYAIPGGDGGLVRRPEGETNTTGLTLLSRFNVNMGSIPDNTTADIIIWNGNRYTPIAQNAYTNFGEGYYLILADQLPLNPSPT